MSAEDDLLNSFFAEINSLPTPAASEQPKAEEKTVITTNKFVEYADPIVGKPKIKEPAKPKVEERYIPPQFAEVDPEEKKQERLNKFFQNEVVRGGFDWFTTRQISRKRGRISGGRMEKRGSIQHILFLASSISFIRNLNDWNASDFRLFVGNLGREVTTEVLTNQFRRYASFTKAKVIENKLYKGSQGYGFVAFSDPLEGIKAMKEMNGKLCGNRPMKIQKSDWEKKEMKSISTRFHWNRSLTNRSRRMRRRRGVSQRPLPRRTRTRSRACSGFCSRVFSFTVCFSDQET